MIYTGFEKPLASKNRILDFAQFQNYKYILNPKTPFSEIWRGDRSKLSGAILARTLDEKIHLPGFIAFGKFDSRDVNIQAIGLTAFYTLEVHMLVLVFGGGTGTGAERVLEASSIVEYFVDKTAVKEGLQCSVNGHAIDVVGDFAFDIAVGQRIVLL